MKHFCELLSQGRACWSLTGMKSLETLTQEAVAGNRDSLENLAKALLDFVFRICFRSLGSREEAEDAAQEIVITAMTHLAQFEFRSSVKTWITSQAIRTLARWKFRRQRTVAKSREEIMVLIERGLAVTTVHSLPEGDVQLLARDTQVACARGMLNALSDS
jgi:DNA-directed RNA polymerase specialized sigma24 family protein